jgi:hypothetical protein
MKEEKQRNRSNRPQKKSKGSSKRQDILKRRRMLLVGAILVVVIIVALLVLQKSGVFEVVPEQGLLSVQDDGTVVCEEVSDFDQEFYTKSTLKTYIKQELAAFNESFGSGSAVLDQMTVKDQRAYVKVSYASTAAYQGFSGFTLFQGTIAEAQEAGYDFSDAFVSVADGEKQDEAKVLDITAQPDLHVVILGENVRVAVDGTICYVSDSNTTLEDARTVVIAQSDGNDDAIQLTYIVYEVQ